MEAGHLCGVGQVSLSSGGQRACPLPETLSGGSFRPPGTGTVSRPALGRGALPGKGFSGSVK